MSYVLVTADFPGATPHQRSHIYECLKAEHWVKVTEPGRDIDTVWYASFGDQVSESGALQTSINEFVKCSSPYCKPKLALHWGPNKPTFYGLV